MIKPPQLRNIMFFIFNYTCMYAQHFLKQESEHWKKENNDVLTISSSGA